VAVGQGGAAVGVEWESGDAEEGREGEGMTSDRVQRILLEIGRLTANELVELNERLRGDEPPGSAGVREPLRPPPQPREGRA
jgi:hypothetical protein